MAKRETFKIDFCKIVKFDCKCGRRYINTSNCRQCTDGREKQTNADRIRSMSDEELANENVYFVSEFVAQQGLRYTGLDGHYYRTGKEVVEANKKWLQSEVEG